MGNLLKKANDYKRRTFQKSNIIPFTKEEVPVLIAYLKGEISTRQYCHALDINHPGSITHRASSVLKQAVINGWVELKSNI